MAWAGRGAAGAGIGGIIIISNVMLFSSCPHTPL